MNAIIIFYKNVINFFIMNNIDLYYTSSKALSDALYCDSCDYIAHLLSNCSIVTSVKVNRMATRENHASQSSLVYVVIHSVCVLTARV